jgi:transcriptional regulator with XRE-family HTH domain
MQPRYQLLPPLSPEEYAALKADIEARGVLVPVEYDEDGNILDGFHRVQICQELGRDWPRAICQGLTEDQKLERALQLNLARRHLSKEHKQQLAIQLRQQGWTQARIADALLVSQGTVSMWLNEFINIDKLASPERIHGKDGKRYPGRKTRHTSTQHPREADKPQGALDTLSTAHQKSPQLEHPINTEVPTLGNAPTERQSVAASALAAISRSPTPRYVAFDHPSEPAAATVEALPWSQPPAPQHELPDVLRLMSELCIALQRHHEEALATARQGWNLALMHTYSQTCSALIEQLQVFQHALEQHYLTIEQSHLGEGQGPDHAGLGGSARQGDTSERALFTPAESQATSQRAEGETEGASPRQVDRTDPDRPLRDRPRTAREQARVLQAAGYGGLNLGAVRAMLRPQSS